jgi:hypothetical protein
VTVTGRPHVGGIYTASNFAFIGTSHRTGYWLDDDGVRVSLPMCYRRFKTKSAGKIAALNPGWRFAAGERKNLFVYPMRLKVPAVLEAIGGDGKRYNPDAAGIRTPERIRAAASIRLRPCCARCKRSLKADLGDLW